MAAVTLTTLRARVRERADMVGSSFVTDAATSLDALINEGAAELHDLLVTHYGDEYVESSHNFNTVAGTSDYAVPADFLKLLSIEIALDGKRYDLDPFMRKERNVFRNANVDYQQALPHYRLVGANIRLLPVPTAVYTIYLHYAPAATLLVNAGDTVNFPNGWERYVVLSAAIKALRKEESSTAEMQAELNALRAHIEASAAGRDTGAPQQAIDVEASDADWPFWGR